MSNTTAKLCCTNGKQHPEDKQQLYERYRPEATLPKKCGKELLNAPHLNKGTAFTIAERQTFGVHGLLPAAVLTQDIQAARVLKRIREQKDDLSRYILLDSLQDRNERLFYRLLCDHTKELMPIVYTPTVGEACQKFSSIFRQPKGLYITINDNSVSKIYEILSNWSHDDIRAIVVTDGERILGLGDLGACGMGIPVGKLALYVALAGVWPKWCLPVLLDVGTNNKEFLNDPFYIGLRQYRVTGKEYDTLVDNFMKACVKKYGQRVLIQFEDFARQNAHRLLVKYQDRYCTFNDDIQGTACVVVAAMLASTRVTKRKFSETKFLFLGAGESALGVAELIVDQMISEGLSRQQACAQVYLINSKGLIAKNSQLSDQLQADYAKDLSMNSRELLDIVRAVKPNALFGFSTIGGAFSEAVLKEMTVINQTPIVFALSNPTSKAECTAEQCYRYTNGKALFASGSPFDDVEVNGHVHKPGQANNAYVFPGVALGAILFEIAHVDNNVFLQAARKIAEQVTEEDLKHGMLCPPLANIREISIQVALQLGVASYKNGTARLYPEPVDKELFIRSQVFNVQYDDYLKNVCPTSGCGK